MAMWFWKKMVFGLALLAALILTFLALRADRPTEPSGGVVINEVFYNAPDDMDDIQWIELHNASSAPVDLSGWTLDEGKVYTFAAQTRVPANGFIVVALNPERFFEIYSDRAVGPLKRALKRGGEKLELRDSDGRLADAMRYGDRPPWPTSADGYSASLERICPSAPGDVAENWAGSPLPAVPSPAGTPGRANANFSAALPPAVTWDVAPTDVGPGQPLRVEAVVRGDAAELALIYRVVTNGAEGEEATLPMSREEGNRFVAEIPAQAAGSLVRYRVRAVGEDGSTRFCPAQHDLRPTVCAYVHDAWQAASIPIGVILLGEPDRAIARQPRAPRPVFGPPGGGPPMEGRGPRPNFPSPSEEAPRPPRGSSTFVYFDPEIGETTVFDHISAVPRTSERGFKVFFHKDHPLNEMSAVNLVFEGSEWSLMAEHLAYDLYRRAGSPAPLSSFVRLWVDGRPVGHHLMVERPNRSFLRRNQIDDGGNLYKKLWMARDVIGQHEKRTHTQTGHEDLLALLDRLDEAAGDRDRFWKVIQESFDVEQVATYFAVNMVLSHWDGFFNNYFAYHDTERDKWQMYPWDQDKTWGYYDSLPDDQVFFDMPLTFGMAGDRPPEGRGGAARGGGPPGGFGGPRGAIWWREGGPFSQPLLANPEFRAVFLARTRDILERLYTEETYFPMIDGLVARLGEDAAIRAALRGEDAAAGARLLARDAELLKTHLTKRCQFLLKQEELKATPSQSPSPPGGG